MIFDRISESKRYELMHPLFHVAFEFLTNAEKLEPGRYDLEKGVYVNIMSGETVAAENGNYESHRRYIDIQCLLNGKTLLWWANTGSLTPINEYNAEGDCCLYKGNGKPIPVSPGDFYVLYPSDGHLPNTMVDGCPAFYKVAVAKVPID